jgi:drug/metabolite transporter (DMT)-like permease
MSSCVSFTTGPIFAAVLAFVMIREKLKCNEIVPILLGIIGTCMITMPEWFLWTGIDTTAIQERLTSETKANSHYYFGITLAFTSSALDVGTYFIIRKVGSNIPKAMYPFISGLLNSTIIIIYICFNDPFDFGMLTGSSTTDAAGTTDGKELAPSANSEYTTALLLAFGGAFFGWMGLELMVIGLNISKSALASYGEMMGITVPFIFDALVFDRTVVMTDMIGLALIIVL